MSGDHYQWKTTGLDDPSVSEDDVSDGTFLPPNEAARSGGGRPKRHSSKAVTQPMTTTTTKRKRAPPKPKGKSTGTPLHTGPFVPIREYYHSTSLLKIKDNEWEKEVDSDDELDQSWLHELERSEIHDTMDMSEDEKKMMILWNDFARSDTVIPAKKIPQMCLDFVEQHYAVIRDSNLDSQLPLHLANLWDEGLISADHLSFCLEHYHALAGSSPL